MPCQYERVHAQEACATLSARCYIQTFMSCRHPNPSNCKFGAHTEAGHHGEREKTNPQHAQREWQSTWPARWISGGGAHAAHVEEPRNRSQAGLGPPPVANCKRTSSRSSISSRAQTKQNLGVGTAAGRLNGCGGAGIGRVTSLFTNCGVGLGCSWHWLFAPGM